MVVIMGQGVESRGALSWFETKPLFGWQVLVPRTKEQGTSTAEALGELGAVGTVVPTIAVQPPRTPTQMEKAIRGLVDGSYEWVGFTSVNAVRAVRMWFEDFGLDSRSLSGVKVAAVGGRTAAVGGAPAGRTTAGGTGTRAAGTGRGRVGAGGEQPERNQQAGGCQGAAGDEVCSHDWWSSE